MNRSFTASVLVVCALAAHSAQAGQSKDVQPPNPAQLELTSYVATTTSEGQPAALRITLKNIGSTAVDLPMPGVQCTGADGALVVQYEWHPQDPDNHSGRGWGCGSGMSDRPSLMDRARKEWIRLQLGEFITVTENIRSTINDMDPGLVDYWVEYSPSEFTPNERIELRQAGYLTPTEKLKTPRHTFKID